MMLVASQKVRVLLKNAYQFTTKSRRQNTPRLFKNPKLTPLGIMQKQPKSYDYNLPENLPNRHLYWNRSVQNKLYRQRYNKQRLLKLKIKPIHNNEKQRTFTRQMPEIIAQMTSVRLIKSSLGRTMTNLYEAITRFSAQFVGIYENKQLVRGKDFDILNYTLEEVHKRHLATMDFYTFSSYCQLRYMAKVQPSQKILTHFFKHLEGIKTGKTTQISLQRLSQLSRYIFSVQYSDEWNELLYKKKINFNLFEDTQPQNLSFEHIIPDLFSNEDLREKVKELVNHKKDDKDRQIIFDNVKKMPGGQKLVQKAISYM